jgi:anthranilate synthase component 1
VEREFAKVDYLAAVTRAKGLIEGGDFMQVQVGQRLKKRYTESPLSLYRALRSLNPSPYMYYYHLGDFHVVGASPEILVRQETVSTGEPAEQKITIRPLAGTRARGASLAQDRAAEAELINDPKERAEHVMLIDLARNDIGRIAKTGSVKVTEAFSVERYSHVMHMTSQVSGDIRDGLGPIDVLRATLPAGTVSGAPKVRAMEIIDELEPVKRGPYAGVVGYVDFSGNLDTAIAIRTMFIGAHGASLQAGAGIVADSIPEEEDLECFNKAAALFAAVPAARRMSAQRKVQK